MTVHPRPLKRSRLTGLLPAALAALVAAPTMTAEAAPPDRAALARMDRAIEDGMDRSSLPGFAVAVVSDGEIVHARGFGEAGSGRPVTPDTPFLLGSTAKSFTALAAMQLVDANKLELDAPARRYVPEFQLAERGAADRITVRQLLQHTSGLPPSAGGPITKSAVDGTALDAVRELRSATLATTPGTEFAYANPNYILAGLVIERASGEPYGPYVQQHIFSPLGMRHSFTSIETAERAGLAVGHRFWFGFPVAHGPTFRAGIQSAGYLISSASDMARYLAMYLADGVGPDGRRIVSERALETMLAPGRPGTLGPWADHAASRYAMGWYVGGPWSEPALLHPGRAPDSSALGVLFPERDMGVVTLTNAANQLTVPGYPASVDRVERNAVDALIGEPVDSGTSLRRFYLLFDAVALILLAMTSWSLLRAVRAARSGEQPGHRWRAALGVAVRVVAGLLLIALPIVALGWQAAFLWQPDLATLIVLLGAVVLLTAAVRLAALLRSKPSDRTAPVSA